MTTTAASPHRTQEAQRIEVPQPQGRALLQWEGKYKPDAVAVPCFEAAEIAAPGVLTHINATEDDDALNRLYHGDNQGVLAHLLAQGWGERMRLIYIDPPFDSGLAYASKARTRGERRRVVGETIQYRDIWPGDSYLQFMYTRLLLMRALLAPNGVIWLHCDYRQAHRLQLMLEEVFGAENYLNTVAWRSQTPRGAKVNAFYLPNSAHFLHVFAKERRADPIWHSPRKRLTFTRRQAAAQFMQDEQGFFRTSDPGTYSFARLQELHAQGRLYAPFGGEVKLDPTNQRVYCSKGGNVGVKYYLTQESANRFSVERAVDNLWDDIPGLGTTPGEDAGYPTQKTEALLERIIGASTDLGDWVLDCFMGSGTTPVVAQRMGRRWIGCDVGYGAVQTTRRRLYADLFAADEHARPAAGFVLCRATKNPDGTPQDNKPTLTKSAPTKSTPTGAEPALNVLLTHADTCATEGQSPAADPWQILLTVAPHTDKRHSDEKTDAWRAWIETVEIDPAYDHQLFRPQIVDAPANRRDCIAGRYAVATARRDAWIAVRVTHVTGHESLFTAQTPPAHALIESPHIPIPIQFSRVEG